LQRWPSKGAVQDKNGDSKKICRQLKVLLECAMFRAKDTGLSNNLRRRDTSSIRKNGYSKRGQRASRQDEKKYDLTMIRKEHTGEPFRTPSAAKRPYPAVMLAGHVRGGRGGKAARCTLKKRDSQRDFLKNNAYAVQRNRLWS